VIELETERLRMRPFREDDFGAYAAICADPEVMRFLGGCKSPTEAYRHMAQMLGHWQLRSYGMFALEERASGLLVGRVGFNHWEGWPGFEVAWTLARAHWGRGFATEAARAALEWAEREIEQDHVISLIDPANRASIAVAERIGETFERTLDGWFDTRVSVYGKELRT